MTIQYKVKQELATFIEQLHKNFGEDAVLKRAEIIRFSERLGLEPRVWISFRSLGTRQGHNRYSLPRLIDVSVLPAKALAKAKTHPMKDVIVNAVIAAVKKRSFGPVNTTGRNKAKMIDGRKVLSTKRVLKLLAARNGVPEEMIKSDNDEEQTYRNTTSRRDDEAAISDVLRDHDGGRISISASE